ncbi:MAG TPA: Crp/Fnr family transcriptional regulator, partial [Chitinophaga sp.]|uniref:Crp/Fnr family transcriptional regulator n=1 Tax=Chitinophaga sp. TaxID=1869181 RepID=UPI002DBF4B15
ITKPFSATDILQAIERRLKKAEMKNQVFSADLNGLGKLMQQVTGKELLLLSEGRDMNMYKKRQYIYSEGNHPSWLFYLQKGKVKAFRRNEDGKELITQLYNEGDFLGYTALLENTTYKDTAEAMEECKVAVVPREDFEELLYSNNEVAVQLARLLARNVTIKEQQLIGLAYNSLRKKVAEALVSLQQKYNPHGTSTFTIDISRDNLAAIAGTATESVVRTLAQFREEGLIDVKSGAVVILDEKKLSSMLY